MFLNSVQPISVSRGSAWGGIRLQGGVACPTVPYPPRLAAASRLRKDHLFREHWRSSMSRNVSLPALGSKMSHHAAARLDPTAGVSCRRRFVGRFLLPVSLDTGLSGFCSEHRASRAAIIARTSGL